MKVIDLLNKIANHENYRPKIKIQLTKLDKEYVYKYNKIYGEYVKENNDEKFGLLSDWCIEKILNEEVEILEDKTEEIEEIKVDRNNFIHTELGSFKGRKMDIAFVNKFNELTKIVNKLNKQDISKETHCMTD